MPLPALPYHSCITREARKPGPTTSFPWTLPWLGAWCEKALKQRQVKNRPLLVKSLKVANIKRSIKLSYTTKNKLTHNVKKTHDGSKIRLILSL